MFNSVEGNTTFSALPSADTVAHWDAQTPVEFRFCFKFPREVTHAFHAMLRAHADVGDLPASPGAARQLGLF